MLLQGANNGVNEPPTGILLGVAPTFSGLH